MIENGGFASSEKARQDSHGQPTGNARHSIFLIVQLNR
jgi:hypothetical protein